MQPSWTDWLYMIYEIGSEMVSSKLGTNIQTCVFNRNKVSHDDFRVIRQRRKKLDQLLTSYFITYFIMLFLPLAN